MNASSFIIITVLVYGFRGFTNIVKKYRLQKRCLKWGRNSGHFLHTMSELIFKRMRFTYMRTTVVFRIRTTSHRSPLRQHSGMESMNDGVGKGYPKVGRGILRRWTNAFLTLWFFSSFSSFSSFALLKRLCLLLVSFVVKQKASNFVINAHKDGYLLVFLACQTARLFKSGRMIGVVACGWLSDCRSFDIPL